jgi:hypothetical protein
VIVALWIARTAGRVYARPFVLPVLAVAALLPAVSEARYVEHPNRVPFFADGFYADCIARDERLAIFPYNADPMLWQVETGFRFRLAGGYMYPNVYNGPALSKFDEDQAIDTLHHHTDIALPTVESLLAFAGRHHVDRIVSVVGNDYPSERQLRRFGRVQRIGGVFVTPRCGDPPLTARDLTPIVRKADEQIAIGDSIGYCLDGSYYTLPVGLYPSGLLEGAFHAPYVAGLGLSCVVPAGYKHHGFATPEMSVRPNTYPYYEPG